MFKNQGQHVKLMQITSYDLVYQSHRPFKQCYSSKKCPNDWPFCLAHYIISFNPNHLLESQNVIAFYINRSCCQIMSEDHTNLIFQKQANIGTFF